MTAYEFEKLKVVNLYDVIKDLFIGDMFLTPELESQKISKKHGDVVSAYVVINISAQGNISYEPRYITLA